MYFLLKTLSIGTSFQQSIQILENMVENIQDKPDIHFQNGSRKPDSLDNKVNKVESIGHKKIRCLTYNQLVIIYINYLHKMGQICHVRKCAENFESTIHAISENKSEHLILIESKKLIPIKIESKPSPGKPQGISSTPQQIYQTEEFDLDLDEQIQKLESGPVYVSNSLRHISPTERKHRNHDQIKKQSVQFSQQQADEISKINLYIPISQRRLIPSLRQMRQQMYEQRRKEYNSQKKKSQIKKVMFADQINRNQINLLNNDYQGNIDFQVTSPNKKKNKSNIIRLYGSQTKKFKSCSNIQISQRNDLIRQNNSLSPNGILKKQRRQPSIQDSNSSQRKKKVHFSGTFNFKQA